MKYYLSSNNHETGPYSREELLNSLSDGTIDSQSLVREEGSETWKSVTSLTGSAEAPPPITSTAIVPVPQQTAVHPPAAYRYEAAVAPRDNAIAVMLELLPGMFMQTFGIGNIYAGNVALGIVLMLSYWALTVINFFLVFIAIGLITWPLTFIVFMVVGIVTAQQGVDRANWRHAMAIQGQS